MKKRLLSVLTVAMWLFCLGSVVVSVYTTARYVSMRKSAAEETPVLRAYDEDGNEIPVRALSDDEVEEMMNTPTVALSVEDFSYFLAVDESFLDYASSSTPDFRNESAKTARGARKIEGSDEYILFDEPYLEGPPISMEHFADMVDYYKDHNESVVLLVYYSWDPFRVEAYTRKFEAYTSSFERADVLQYWGESRDPSDWDNEDSEITLGAALEMVPAGQYDHLLIASTESALGDAEELARQVAPRDDFAEVVILTYNAASLRSCPESVATLSEQLGVTPILRPLMTWEVESSE